MWKTITVSLISFSDKNGINIGHTRTPLISSRPVLRLKSEENILAHREILEKTCFGLYMNFRYMDVYQLRFN